MTLGGLIAPVAVARRRPATAANLARNALGGGERARRWGPARDAAWRLLERYVGCDARVAVVGAGNGDDLPLDRLASRARELDLFDLDPAALRRARRRCPPDVRGRVRLRRCEVTAGAANRIAHAVRLGQLPRRTSVPPAGFGEGEYDVVIGDLFYSQLLYPALRDAGVPHPRTRQALAEDGPGLTDAVVAQMHASARPGGRIVHLHDIVGWWDGHPQPVSLEEILAQDRLEDAFALIARCRQPVGADPRESALRLGARVLDTALWEWPFGPGAGYLVCTTVTEPGTG